MATKAAARGKTASTKPAAGARRGGTAAPVAAKPARPARTAATSPPASRTSAASAAKTRAATKKTTGPARPARTGERLTLAQAMAALEAAGSEQTRKTWARHGARPPMFGVSFAALKALYKRIKLDHELALALWDTSNFDAQNLAMKLVDPVRLTRAELDRWARAPTARMCGSYVAHIAFEGPHGRACVDDWLASQDEPQRTVGWKLVGVLALRDETLDDAWFLAHLATIERDLHGAPNAVREAMNHAVIEIGCRNPVLRKSACAAARRIGPVTIDHGDTACKTHEAVATIDKAWDHARAKGAASPAAQERARESMRLRC